MAFTSDKGRQGAAGVSTGYDIDNSLRFNDDDSAYLSRTFSASNRKTWTWSGWVKVSELTGTQPLFARYTGGSDSGFLGIYFDSGGKLHLTGWLTVYRNTTAKYRDPSAWYHIVCAIDTTQSTADNRIKIYVNGEQITDFSSSSNPSQNTDMVVNDAAVHRVGSYASNYFDGYLSEVHFIDGTALTPTSFGETGDYGEWKAKKVSGLTYGTNGFHLDFKTSGTLGNDANGSNNWTTNNLASTDQMVDTPTNNFCTLNPLDKESLTLSEGNLQTSAEASDDNVRATISQSAGKWYWESIETSTIESHLGILDVSNDIYSLGYMGSTADSWGIYTPNGNKRNNGSYVSYGSALATDDVLMTAVDLDSGKIWWGKNGTWFASGNPSSGTNAAFTNVSGEVSPAVTSFRANVLNFGQDSSFAGNKTAQGNSDGGGIGDFYYTPPTGFLALCTKNLPDPAVIPSEHFNTVLYTGNNSAQSISSVGFQPDLVWMKSRSSTQWHRFADSIRGGTKILYTNSASAEASGATLSFDSDGFSFAGANGTNANDNTVTYVGWNWKANGTGASNTSGSITSTVSANQDAGFSIVKWTSPGLSSGQSATIGHGLSKTPDMVIVKRRDSSGNWSIGTTDLGWNNFLYFTTAAKGTSAGAWNNTSPTPTVFTIGSYDHVSSGTQVAYCFHSVDGYSKVGSYTGNGNADGTFVYTGFRPAYVMLSNTATSGEGFVIFNNKADPYNVHGTYQVVYDSTGEQGTQGVTFSRSVDFLSNGFKWRGNSTEVNQSGVKHIFIAFAESPFKHTNAR